LAVFEGLADEFKLAHCPCVVCASIYILDYKGNMELSFGGHIGRIDDLNGKKSIPIIIVTPIIIT